MGMRAERLTGYFLTSASKRAANSGEKTEAGSGWVSCGLISSILIAASPVTGISGAANQFATSSIATGQVAARLVAANRADLTSGPAPIVPRPDPWPLHYYRRAGF